MSDTYKIGEAANLLNLKTYVLRFWETEFPDVVPLRTEKGQRLYTLEHLALLERIRYLLHDRGLTIGGARRILAEEKTQGIAYAFDPSQPRSEQAGAVQASLPFSQAQPGRGAPVPPNAPIDPYYDAVQEDGGPPAWPQERDPGEQPYAQYSLPGVAPRIPAGISQPEGCAANDAAQGEARDGAARSPHLHADDQRMLPLFGAIAGGAGPLRRPGGNFIQTGLPGATPTPPPAGPELQEALDARDEAQTRLQALEERSRTELLDILNELESIASLLRG